MLTTFLKYIIVDWNTNFLHKALGKMIPTLKKGGKLEAIKAKYNLSQEIETELNTL